MDYIDLLQEAMQVDYLDESSFVYKTAEFGATMLPATGVNYYNQKKLIKEVVNNSKSDKEAIEKLTNLKKKFKSVKTWRTNHGNVVPVVDKALKAKICQKAVDACDEEIEKIRNKNK